VAARNVRACAPPPGFGRDLLLQLDRVGGVECQPPGLADLEVAELAQYCEDAVLAGGADRTRPGADVTADIDEGAAIALLSCDLRVDALDPLEHRGAVRPAQALQRDVGQNRQQPVIADLLNPGPCGLAQLALAREPGRPGLAETDARRAGILAQHQPAPHVLSGPTTVPRLAARTRSPILARVASSAARSSSLPTCPAAASASAFELYPNRLTSLVPILVGMRQAYPALPWREFQLPFLRQSFGQSCPAGLPSSPVQEHRT